MRNKKSGNETRPVTPRFVEALGYAARLHAKQVRKRTKRPYIGHLLGVTSMVIEYGGDEEMAIAGLLRDAVELARNASGLPKAKMTVVSGRKRCAPGLRQCRKTGLRN